MTASAGRRSPVPSGAAPRRRGAPSPGWALALALLWSGLLAPARAAHHPYESQGWRWTVVPIVNYSSDDGTGYGVRINLYEYDGHSVPYRRSCGLQGFFTTEGKRVHRILLDVPRLRPGQRLEADVVYEKEKSANYLGGLSDERVGSYTEDQRTFRQAYPKATATWIRDLRGPWRWRVGLQAGHCDVAPNAQAGSILGSQAPLGAAGGLWVQANTSLRRDTRDDYLDTGRGVFEELLLAYGWGGGGAFHGGRIGHDHRHFLPLREGWVFAHRVLADVTFGAVPFFEAPDLGGSSTVRGVLAARERGEARLLANAEVRWSGSVLSRRQSVRLGAVWFVDAGQTFARTHRPSVRHWRSGTGAGLRLHWHSTIVRADYGVAAHRTGLYITFAEVF